MVHPATLLASALAFAACVTVGNGQLNFGGDCDSGGDTFQQDLFEKQTVTIGSIPTGKRNIRIDLSSVSDVDIQIIDETVTPPVVIIGYPSGLIGSDVIDGARPQSIIYAGMLIKYSGFNGGQSPAKYGEEYIEIVGDTTINMTMAAFAYKPGDATVTYCFLAAHTCWEEGSDNFVQQIVKDDTVLVGIIPAGVVNVEITLDAGDEDVDIELSDPAAGVLIIAYCPAAVGEVNLCSLIDSPGEKEVTYQGLNIWYSGYEGTDNFFGREKIIVTGVTTVDLQMDAFGFNSGFATIVYSWGGEDSGVGDACELASDCVDGMKCTVKGECHTPEFCGDVEPCPFFVDEGDYTCDNGFTTKEDCAEYGGEDNAGPDGKTGNQCCPLCMAEIQGKEYSDLWDCGMGEMCDKGKCVESGSVPNTCALTAPETTPVEGDFSVITPTGCFDTDGWESQYGACVKYEEKNWCPQFKNDPGTGDKTAEQSCCVCGKGDIDEEEPTVEPTCTSYPGWVSTFDGNPDCIAVCPNYEDDVNSDGITAKLACCGCGGSAETVGDAFVCVDQVGWVSDYDDSLGCDFYAESEWCPQYKGDLGSGGKTAAEACCACGKPAGPIGATPGPTASPTPAPTTAVPTENPTATPTKTPTGNPSITEELVCEDVAEWISSYDGKSGCAVYVLQEWCPQFKDDMGNTGLTAEESCCACGRPATVPLSQTSTLGPITDPPVTTEEPWTGPPRPITSTSDPNDRPDSRPPREEEDDWVEFTWGPSPPPPTGHPTLNPTLHPTSTPTLDPTWFPTPDPTMSPTTGNPTPPPTKGPTKNPSKYQPTPQTPVGECGDVAGWSAFYQNLKCSFYDTNPGWCADNHLGLFSQTSKQACCACGGGYIGTATPTFAPSAVPTRTPTTNPSPPTPGPTQLVCTDFPSWQDTDGHGCSTYAKNDVYCEQYGGTITGTFGMNAQTACCFCGGGQENPA